MSTLEKLSYRRESSVKQRIALGGWPLLHGSISALVLAMGISAPMTAVAGVPSKPSVPTLLGQTAPAKLISLALTLPSRDGEGAKDFVAHVTRPGDPLFHHYLSTADYVSRFAASQSDYDAVVSWAIAQGMTLGEYYAARTVVTVTCPVGVMQAALGLKFYDYKAADGRIFHVAEGQSRLPDAIAGKVSSVIGLSSAAQGRPLIRMLPQGAHSQSSGTGPGGGYSAADLRSIYNVPTLPFGAQSQTLAVFELGGFAESDVATYARQNKLPRIPATLRRVDGYKGGINNLNVAIEAVLDIDMQIAMNPAAKNILVYEDGLDTFQVALLDGLSAMASDNTASAISISYGEDEELQGADAIAAENVVLTQMAAQGQAVFVSAGDNGAFGNGTSLYNVADPASQPLVTAVGGTSLFTGAHESYSDEEVWNDLEGDGGAGGGGISVVWPLPEYQRFFNRPHAESVATANGGSATFRNVPDVAALADPRTGVAIYSSLSGGWVTVGGTSVGAPLWAGIDSLASTISDAYGLGTRIGFINPMLYTFPHSLAFLQPATHDVLDGNNGVVENGHLLGFFAGARYDNTTGNGSPLGFDTVVDLAFNPPLLSGTNPPSAPSRLQATATPNTATIFWHKAGDATGYFVELQNQNTLEITSGLALKPPLTFTGLTPNSFYTYVVTSVSSGGFTLSSFPAIATPPAKSN